MKAISLWQPWAALWVLGFKRNETRGFGTLHRGPLAVHAAKRPYRESEYDEAFVRSVRECIDPQWLVYGCILGMVNVTGCVRTEAIRDRISARERMFGNYEDGRFAWTADHIALIEPIPHRGRQGFFQVAL